MASRRVQQTKARQMVEDLVSEDEDDDLDFFASQQSSGSDDNECDPHIFIMVLMLIVFGEIRVSQDRNGPCGTIRRYNAS